MSGPVPLLRVVKGEPTPEELAALVAVVSAYAAAAAAGESAPVSDAPGWGVDRPGLHPGPGAWRASAHVPGTRTRAAW